MEQKLLQTLQSCKTLNQLKQTQLQILLHGLSQSGYLLPKLIDLSSTFSSLNYAIQIFKTSKTLNTVVHNTMIKCFTENHHPSESFSTYSDMRASGVSPNNFTFTFLLKASESLQSLELSKGIHAQITKHGFESIVFVQNVLLSVYYECSKDSGLARRLFDTMWERDVVTWNSMVGVYMDQGDTKQAIRMLELMPERNIVSWNSIIIGLCKAGEVALARSVFDRMAKRNAISWNAMIAGHVMWGDVASARSLFDRMEEKTVVSWTTMISGYIKIGDLESASRLFHQMPVKNTVSWNAMISGYNQNHQFDYAIRMFQLMLLDAKFVPDDATLTSVVSACAHLGSLEHGNWVHSYIKKINVFITLELGNALIDMFAKCGDVKSSQEVFEQMKRRCIITWTTMVSGLAINGQCREALALFNKMCREGVEPDDVIFIAVLSACTHGGFVEEGQEIFDQMVEQYGIKPRMEHYGCMVDLLSRAGRLEEAIQFIERMPIEPNVVIWATLLSSCVTHGVDELVESVNQKIVDLEPLNPSYRVLVSNLSACGGRWEGVMGIRAMMRDQGIEKVPGCSLIQVGGEVHEFLVKDTMHRSRIEIYEALDGLSKLMRQVGYVHRTSQDINPIETTT